MNRAYPPVYFPVRPVDALRSLPRRETDPSGYYFNSGRAALEIALRCLKERLPADRLEVIVPSFVCSSVPRAVEAAGFKPIFATLDPGTWFYDIESLEALVGPATATVIVVFYFGLAPDCGSADKGHPGSRLTGVPVVEDRAQAFGFSPEPLPPLPTAFFVYSFGPGKSLPMAHGGLVQALAETDRERVATLWRGTRAESGARGIVNLTQTVLQRLVLHPLAWRFVWKPVERWHFGGGEEPGTIEIRRLAGCAARYTEQARSTLRRQIEIRRTNALALREKLAGLEGLMLPSIPVLQRSVCLRLPVYFHDPAQARTTLTELTRSNVLVGGGDWSDYEGRRPEGIALSQRLVTLPTYEGSQAIHRIMAESIRKALLRDVSPG